MSRLTAAVVNFLACPEVFKACQSQPVPPTPPPNPRVAKSLPRLSVTSLTSSIEGKHLSSEKSDQCYPVTPSPPLLQLNSTHLLASDPCALGLAVYVLYRYDVEAMRMVRRFKGHKDRVTGVVISQDARWLLSSSMDGTVRVWDIPAASCLQVLLCIA